MHLRLIGPFVLPSEMRRAHLAALPTVVIQLESMPGITGVRLLESTFVVPLPGGPRFDVVLMVNGDDVAIESAHRVISRSGLPEPSFESTARNVERFGDTDALDGPILLNHFASSRSPEEVARVWTGISFLVRGGAGCGQLNTVGLRRRVEVRHRELCKHPGPGRAVHGRPTAAPQLPHERDGPVGQRGCPRTAAFRAPGQNRSLTEKEDPWTSPSWAQPDGPASGYAARRCAPDIEFAQSVAGPIRSRCRRLLR
jgi:hypothetical protein